MYVYWTAEDIQRVNRQVLLNGVAADLSWNDSPDYSANSVSGYIDVPVPPGATVDAVVRITDHNGATAEGMARYTSTATTSVPRRAPMVTLIHHDGFRDASIGSVSIGYSTPEYVSLDVPKSVSLVQLSGQALLEEFLHMDVIDPSSDQAPLLSLSVTEVGTGTRMWLRDGDPHQYWVATGSRRAHRIGTFWTMDRPTGD